MLDGATGKSVLQFTRAALISSKTGREVRPDEVVNEKGTTDIPLFPHVILVADFTFFPYTF